GAFRHALFVLWRRGDGEGDFLNSRPGNDVQNAKKGAVSWVLIAADVRGQIRVDAKFIGENQMKLPQVDLGFLDVHVAELVHGNVENVRFEVARGLRGRGQIHFDGLHPNHRQARQHERSE